MCVVARAQENSSNLAAQGMTSDTKFFTSSSKAELSRIASAAWLMKMIQCSSSSSGKDHQQAKLVYLLVQ